MWRRRRNTYTYRGGGYIYIFVITAGGCGGGLIARAHLREACAV
jgi:uncharacterized membrane protein